MGVFSRLTDIINANLNSLLEKAEDPEKIVRLMIQEMEETLVDVRSTTAKNIADKKERQRILESMRREQQGWQEKAELAISKDRDDLAKAALLEKTRLDEKAELLEKELTLVDEHLDKLNGDISKLQSKLDDAKNRQRSLIMRHKAATTQLKVRSQIHGSRIDDAMNRFEYAERRIDAVESEVESFDYGRKQGLAEEFTDLVSNEKVDDELAKLKAKMNPAKEKKA